MLGPILLALAILVVIPVSVMMGLGVVAAILSSALTGNGEATHEGSELIDLNV
jgi:hypothetical protein